MCREVTKTVQGISYTIHSDYNINTSINNGSFNTKKNIIIPTWPAFLIMALHIGFQSEISHHIYWNPFGKYKNFQAMNFIKLSPNPTVNSFITLTLFFCKGMRRAAWKSGHLGVSTAVIKRPRRCQARRLQIKAERHPVLPGAGLRSFV